jgi:hypothetical protein
LAIEFAGARRRTFARVRNVGLSVPVTYSRHARQTRSTS